MPSRPHRELTDSSGSVDSKVVVAACFASVSLLLLSLVLDEHPAHSVFGRPVDCIRVRLLRFLLELHFRMLLLELLKRHCFPCLVVHEVNTRSKFCEVAKVRGVSIVPLLEDDCLCASNEERVQHAVLSKSHQFVDLLGLDRCWLRADLESYVLVIFRILSVVLGCGLDLVRVESDILPNHSIPLAYHSVVSLVLQANPFLSSCIVLRGIYVVILS